MSSAVEHKSSVFHLFIQNNSEKTDLTKIWTYKIEDKEVIV